MKIASRRGLAPAAAGLVVVLLLLGGGYIYIHPISQSTVSGTHTIPIQSSGATVRVRAYYQNNGSILVGGAISLSILGNSYTATTPAEFIGVPKATFTVTAENSPGIIFDRWAEGQTNSFNPTIGPLNALSANEGIGLVVYYNATLVHMTMTTLMSEGPTTLTTHSSSSSRSSGTQTVTITTSTHRTTSTTTTTATGPVTSISVSLSPTTAVIDQTVTLSGTTLNANGQPVAASGTLLLDGSPDSIAWTSTGTFSTALDFTHADTYTIAAVSGSVTSNTASVTITGSTSTTSQSTVTTTMGGSSTMGIMVPMYMDPGSDWTELDTAKLGNPSVPVVAIINPDNGPGSSSDSTYVSGINTMKSDGIIVAGYVDTMETSTSISSAESQIYDYRSWYDVQAIFLDNMPDSCGYASYYQTLTQYADSLGLDVVIANPGTQTCSTYYQDVNNIMCEENPGTVPASTLASYCNNGSPSPSDYSYIATGVSLPSQSYFNSIYPYVGYVWFTNQGDSYQDMPTASYLASELAECAAAS